MVLCIQGADTYVGQQGTIEASQAATEESVLYATTQTAVLLAELATMDQTFADDELLTDTQSVNQHSSACALAANNYSSSHIANNNSAGAACGANERIETEAASASSRANLDGKVEKTAEALVAEMASVPITRGRLNYGADGFCSVASTNAVGLFSYSLRR